MVIVKSWVRWAYDKKVGLILLGGNKKKLESWKISKAYFQNLNKLLFKVRNLRINKVCLGRFQNCRRRKSENYLILLETICRPSRSLNLDLHTDSRMVYHVKIGSDSKTAFVVKLQLLLQLQITSYPVQFAPKIDLLFVHCCGLLTPQEVKPKWKL